MSESANSAKSAKQIFANFAKFVKPICGTTRRSEGSVTEAEYPTNNQRISNLLLTIRPFRVAILAVLLVFVGGWNSEVFAAYINQQYTCTGYSYSKPANTGYTWITLKGTSFDGSSFSQDVSDNSGYDEKFSGWGSAPNTQDVTATMYAKPKDGYEFIGWYDNEAGTGTALSTSSNNNCYYSTTVKAAKGSGNPARNFYAIFAKFKPSTYEIDFGEVAYNTGTHEKKFTIDCHNVGTWSNPSGLSGMLGASLSNNENDNTQHTCTVTISLNTTTAGTYNQTLTVATSRGGTINVTVKAKVTATPSYTWSSALDNLYVGQTVNDVIEFTSSGAKTYSIENWTPTGSNNEGATKPTFANNTLVCSQAGTLTLRIAQDAENNGFEAGGSTKDITIKKRPNTIYVKGNANYSNSIYVDSYDNGLTLTADNTDYTNCPITNTQTAGSDVATFYQNDEVVYSSYKLGTATWTLSQPENYKYQAGNGSFTVNVIQQEEAADCYVKTDINSEHKFNDSWETRWNDENAAGTLRFEACAQAAWTYGMNVYQLIDGNWSLIEYIDHDHMHTNYTDYSYSLDQRAKGVKFEQKGTLNRWVKNVYVTRSTYINASNVTIDRTSTGNPVYPKDGTGVGTLTINYSLANGGDLKIINDNPKFTLDNTTISNVDCKTGTATINISYESDKAGTDVAHLVIYNKVYRKEVTVTGITAKRNQEVHWEIGDALRVGTQTENAAWVTIGSEVSYSSSNTTLLEVVDGKLVAKAEGEVTITATAPGNDEYNAVEDQKTITITNDLTQSIVWEQNFLRLQLGGATQTLNAYVVSDVEGCTTDRARLITYESSDESVVKVINSNQLQIVGAGQAVLTARQAGGVDEDGHKYMAVSAEKAVIVRDPNAPCENYLYIQPQENKWDCGWNLANRQYREFVIDNLDEPSTLYLQYKGEYKTVGVDYFGGTMHVDEWYDGAWHEVPNGNLGTPSIGTYKTLNTTLQRKTTKVRIRTNDGVGYHYFKDCKIGQSRYIEASDLTIFEAKVGQVVNQQLTVRYNNITGPVTLSLGNNNSKFSLSQQSIAGDCGDKGTVDVTVSYLPTVEANEEELLTVSDGTTTLKVTLQGVATKTSRHIVWDLPETNNVHTVDVVELGAQALTDVGNTTAGDVFYAISSSSPAGVGSVAGSNLTFAKAGTVVVTANTVNDARYNDAVTVSKHYNVALTPTTISTMPVLAEVTSGTAAGEIELTGWQVTNTVNGGVVEGTLAITSADLTNVGTNTVTLTFTPSNTDMYSGCTGTTTIVVNKAVSNIFTNASGNGKWSEPANWSNGVPTGDEPDVIISGDLIIDEELTVGNLTIKKNSRVVLTVNGNLTVNGASEDLTEYGDLHVREGGQVNLSNGTLKVHNFTLDAALSGIEGVDAYQEAASGQVANSAQLDVRGDAYFVLRLDPADALTYGWYDFTVPFEVEISNGIYRYGENTPMTSGVDFIVMEHSEAKRAAGQYDWVKTTGTMQPGRVYTITLDKWAYTTYVFKKKSGSSVAGTNSFNAVVSAGNSDTRGWNGMGNGSLQHAKLTSDFDQAKVQLYDHQHNVYVTKEATECNFAVGTSFFIQVANSQTISIVAADENRILFAPSREDEYATDEFRLTLTDLERGRMMDRLWFSASDEATDEYVIGRDLLKMGTPSDYKAAQMWTMKGGKVLCDVETAMNGERATAPLSFYAPKAGQYELAIDQAPEDVTLYLTYNDQVIWILSFGSYVFDLEKGTTEGYGLRMETNRAPQIATGIDEQTAGAQNRKVMINNTLYIVTAEGAIFDVMGKNIK